MYLTEIITNLKKENLTSEKFDTLIKEFEKDAKQVEEKETGILYEFDYYTYTNADQTSGFIKAYRIYDDNTYSTSIVDTFNKCDFESAAPEYSYPVRICEK
mgnify:CR=1 FL=1